MTRYSSSGSQDESQLEHDAVDGEGQEQDLLMITLPILPLGREKALPETEELRYLSVK